MYGVLSILIMVKSGIDEDLDVSWDGVSRC
jgi:hypothetical protein